jgi:putative ABC transport system permease protein
VNFFIELKEGLAIAWDAILANKMRSVLATLGIVIGIVTVTLMGTALDTMNRAFHKSISIIGADTFFVERFSWMAHSEEERQSFRKRREVTWDQAKAVEKQMTLTRGVSPVVVMNQTVRYKDRSASRVQIIGSSEQFLTTSGFSVDVGRFLSAMESEAGRPVCVIGTDVATNLFVNESPIGKRIRVGSRSLEVIGVLARQGKFLGIQSLDNEVIIPIQQLLNGYWRNPDFQIQVKASSLDRLVEAKEELYGLMRKIRRLGPGEPDDFSINQQEQFIEMFNRVAKIIATVGLLVTGLSLFVGGIGIMNIMFVSVAERTREIGVRKAIGAKRRTILLQFLIESASICLIGGLVGLAITAVLTFILGKFMPIPVTLSLPVTGLAILVSLLTGVASGFFPAWRAARMDPVEALRNE